MKYSLILLLRVMCVVLAAPQLATARTPDNFTATEYLHTDNGDLPAHRLFPKGKPKAIVIALHGMNDYSHAFSLPAAYLSEHGIGVYAYDQRSFGASAHPGIWPGEQALVSDLRQAVLSVQQQYPHIPVYLLGESMGGAVAVAATTTPGFPKVDGIILSAPAVWGGDAMNPLYRASLWTLAHIMPGKILTGEGLHIMASDNIPMLRELGHDPLVQKGTRVDSVLGLVRLMDKAYTNMHAVPVPMLILYGKHDEVIPPWAIAGAMKDSAGRFVFYPEGYHLLLRDLHRDIPFADMAGWMIDTKAPLPSGHDLDTQDWEKRHVGTHAKPENAAKWPSFKHISK